MLQGRYLGYTLNFRGRLGRLHQRLCVHEAFGYKREKSRGQLLLTVRQRQYPHLRTAGPQMAKASSEAGKVEVGVWQFT